MRRGVPTRANGRDPLALHFVNDAQLLQLDAEGLDCEPFGILGTAVRLVEAPQVALYAGRSRARRVGALVLPGVRAQGAPLVRPVNLTLGQQAFLRELQAPAEAKRDLVAGARVAVKRNAAGDLVFAVIVPAVRIGTH